jgi:hypothetical protein
MNERGLSWVCGFSTRRVSHDQLVSKRIELVLRHAVANRSEETERICRDQKGLGTDNLPVRRTEPELECVDISRRRVLPQAARVSKRNERPLRHVFRYRSEGTELIMRRPVGFGHRCQPIARIIDEHRTKLVRSHNCALVCGCRRGSYACSLS